MKKCKTVALRARWGTRLLRTTKNYESRRRKDLLEEINENIAKEQKSQEQQLTLWKDRPRLAREEIPIGIFQILQKQHSKGEGNSVPALTRTTVTLSWNPTIFHPPATSTLTYTLPERSLVSIKIYDSTNTLVKTLLTPTTKNAGTYSIVWDGKNDSGVKAAAKKYTCKIYANDMAETAHATSDVLPFDS